MTYQHQICSLSTPPLQNQVCSPGSCLQVRAHEELELQRKQSEMRRIPAFCCTFTCMDWHGSCQAEKQRTQPKKSHHDWTDGSDSSSWLISATCKTLMRGNLFHLLSVSASGEETMTWSEQGGVSVRVGPTDQHHAFKVWKHFCSSSCFNLFRISVVVCECYILSDP